jgi:superkiller protein 3
VALALAGCGDTVSVEEHFAKGNEFTRAGEYEKAIAEFEAALKKDPKNVSAMSNLGVVYYHLERLDDAITQYQKAIELAPKDADIRSNLAAAYVQKGQLDSALEQYQAAINANPQLAEAYFGLGVVYQQMEKKDEAIQAFEKFQSLDTGKDPTATNLAKQYLQQLKGQ